MRPSLEWVIYKTVSATVGFLSVTSYYLPPEDKFLKPILVAAWNQAQLPELTSPFFLEAKKLGVGIGDG